jgi:hypothetical protein
LRDVNLVFGQWEVIAIAEAKTLFELTKIIVGEVRGIQGIQDTTTLLQAELWVIPGFCRKGTEILDIKGYTYY